MARKIVSVLIMGSCIDVTVLTCKLAVHHLRPVVSLTRGDLIFYPVFRLAAATSLTEGIGSWLGVLGDRRSALQGIFLLALVMFLLFGLAPVVATSALGKSEGWVADWRFYPWIAVSGVQTISQVVKGMRNGKPKSEVGPM